MVMNNDKNFIFLGVREDRHRYAESANLFHFANDFDYQTALRNRLQWEDLQRKCFQFEPFEPCLLKGGNVAIEA